MIRRQAFASLAAAVLMTVAFAPLANAKLKEGEMFPVVKAEKLGGGAFDFASLKGKVAIVDFWASWCGPCKIELPALNQLYKKHQAKGLVVVGVNVDEKEADAKAFLKGHSVDFPLVYDGKKKDLIGKVEPSTMPTSLIVDKAGRVRVIHRGFRDGDAASLEKEILALMK